MRRDSTASLTTAEALPTSSTAATAVGEMTLVLSLAAFRAFASICARKATIPRIWSSSAPSCCSIVGTLTVKAAPASRTARKWSSITRRTAASWPRSPVPAITSRLRPPSPGIAMPTKRAVATATRSTDEAPLSSL